MEDAKDEAETRLVMTGSIPHLATPLAGLLATGSSSRGDASTGVAASHCAEQTVISTHASVSGLCILKLERPFRPQLKFIFEKHI